MNKEKFISNSLNESADTKKKILNECKDDILKAVDLLSAAFKNGNKLLLCGNGENCDWMPGNNKNCNYYDNKC